MQFLINEKLKNVYIIIMAEYIIILLVLAKKKGFKIQVYPVNYFWFFDIVKWGKYKKAVEYMKKYGERYY